MTRRRAVTPFANDPPITPELVREHNLTDEEYRQMKGPAPFSPDPTGHLYSY